MGPGLIKKVIDELKEEVGGGVISRVLQPDDKDVILKIFSRGREYRLLISTHHRFSRLHLTEKRFQGPPAPKRFCAFLRSRITDARIKEIRQAPGERVIDIELEKRSDSGAEA